MIKGRVLLSCILIFSRAILFAQDSTIVKDQPLTVEEIEEIAIQTSEEALIRINQQEFDHLNDAEKAYIKAIAYRYSGENKISDSIIQKGINEHSFLNDSVLFIKYLLILADQQKVSFKYEESLKNLYEVVQISRRLKEDYIQIDARISMGELNRATQNYELGLENLALAEDLLKGYYGKDKLRLTARLYDRRSSIFIETRTFPDSIEQMTLKSIDIAKELGNIDLLAGSNNILGSLYLEKKPPNIKAEYYLKQAIQLWDSIGFEIYAVTARQNLARFFLAVNKHQEGIDVLLPIEGMVNTSTWEFHEGYIYGIIGDIYEDMGAFEKAIPYIRKANDLITQRQLVNYNEKLSFYSVQLKVNEKEEEILRNEIKNEKKIAIETQKRENQQILSIAIGIGLVLISLLALFIFNRLKLTRKQNVIIEEQKKKVEQSEKFKEQFLANMSHEIRTPMHAISGMLKILERNEYYPNQKDYLNAMHTSSDNLIVILNDILDLSKIEAGKLDIESIPIQVRLVMENVIQILKFKAEEKGLLLGLKVEDDVPDLIMGDPTRINQILVNLVGNAIKFTEKGSINISLSIKENNLQFRIKDTGVGIHEDRIQHIFGAFEQANYSTNRKFGGTGLGLSISQQLTELQNGKIWVESVEGVGSEFFVELPLMLADTGVAAQDIITEDQLRTMAASLKGSRILLVEDNAFNQMIAQDDLKHYIKDVKIDTVENGQLAVEQFKANEYDLILMDVQMPNMNGFEASQEIRKLEKSASKENAIPIIAMTASLLKTEIDSCFQAGMNNYIPKPYQPEELIAPIYAELKNNKEQL